MKVHVLAGALALAAFAAAPSAQQPADTREAHCAAARAAAGTEYLALYNRFAEVCNPANQPERGRGAGAGAREVPATRDVVPAARKGVRQPVLRRHEASQRMGAPDLRRSHRHRRVVRLCREGFSSRGAAQARPESGNDEVSDHQPRARGSPWRSKVSAGRVWPASGDGRARLGSRREEPARPDSAPRHRRIRWAENHARRHDRDAVLHAGTHVRHVLAHHPGQRRRASSISSRRGEARRWEATRRLQG